MDKESILNNICGFKLDSEQKKFVLDDADATLLVAGAGSGKTLSLIGKIRYLIEYKKIKCDQILCISYTNESVNNLKTKLLTYYNYNVDVKTFHKLSLDILGNKVHSICPSNYLNYIVDEYFKSTIYMNDKMVKNALRYLDLSYNKKEYLKLDTKEMICFKNLIVKFINLFKSNNYDISKFSEIYKKNKYTLFSRYKNKLFLKIVFNIYQIYTEETLSTYSFDFNDIINYASKYIPNNLRYKYIIIDEYQDTSLVRLNLIKNIIYKTNAKLIVVGDDYQSIYRFTGCDLNIFINFKKYFNNGNILYISNTYRNPYELSYVANKFILKNKLQLKKKIMSDKHINRPIKIKYYNKYNNDLFNLIDGIKNKGNILILGRGKNDINKFINANLLDKNGFINTDNNSNTIRYLTVHKSKGLESDNVIIINLENKILGFPNKIEDDNVLKYVILNKEKYSYDEERRLFYVALTRSKNYVYLLVNKNSVSEFVTEIIRDYKKFIEFI